MTYMVRPFITPSKELAQFFIHHLGIFPVVGGACILFFPGADKGSALYAGNVVGTGSVQQTAGKFFLVEFLHLAGGDCFSSSSALSCSSLPSIQTTWSGVVSATISSSHFNTFGFFVSAILFTLLSKPVFADFSFIIWNFCLQKPNFPRISLYRTFQRFSRGRMLNS